MEFMKLCEQSDSLRHRQIYFNFILFTDHFLPCPGEIALIMQKKNIPVFPVLLPWSLLISFFLDIYAIATVLEGPLQNGQVQN